MLIDSRQIFRDGLRNDGHELSIDLLRIQNDITMVRENLNLMTNILKCLRNSHEIKKRLKKKFLMCASGEWSN